MYHINKLKFMAEQLLLDKRLIDEREISTRDITKEFEDEVYNKMISNKESININITAPVRTGKSTVCFAIGRHIQRGICRKMRNAKPFSIYNIARSQYELSLKMRDPKLNNMFICVDEFDDLENTQINSTIEGALLQHFSKIQAGRYIHRGYCSPKDMPDPNSEIILNVESANKRDRTTLCHVYYRIQRGLVTDTQLIGFIVVDVSDIVGPWVDNNIEKIFYSQSRNPSETRLIQHWRKKNWYVEYMCRKFEKMDIINSMGVFQTKLLDYADIYLKCIQELKPFTEIKGFVTKKQVGNTLSRLFQEAIIPTTLLGDTIMSDKVDGILDYWKTYHEQVGKLKELKLYKERGKINPDTYATQQELINNSIKMLHDGATKEESNLRKLADLKKRFYDE